MGRRGPRPKLASLARLDGNPGKRELPDFGVSATGEVVIFDHLHEDAQGCIETVRSSMPPATYATVDSFLLAAFATAWALHKRAAHEVNAPGFRMTVTNSAGSAVPHPMLRILDAQARVMMSAGDRLGLDPKARQALRLPSEKPKSKWDGLLGRDGGRGLKQ